MSLKTIPLDNQNPLAVRAAELTLNGVGLNEQSRAMTDEFKMPITRSDVISLKSHPKYSDALMKAAESGKLQLKAGLSGLVPDLIKCLSSAIKEGGTTGVRASAIAANVLSEKDDQDGPQQAQQLQIIIPGGVDLSKVLKNED